MIAWLVTSINILVFQVAMANMVLACAECWSGFFIALNRFRAITLAHQHTTFCRFANPKLYHPVWNIMRIEALKRPIKVSLGYVQNYIYPYRCQLLSYDFHYMLFLLAFCILCYHYISEVFLHHESYKSAHKFYKFYALNKTGD